METLRWTDDGGKEAEMKTYVGIDPGKSGCVAVMIPDPAVKDPGPGPGGLFDTLGALAYMHGEIILVDAEQLDLYELAKKINLPNGVFVLIEKAQIMHPKRTRQLDGSVIEEKAPQGVVGMLNYGIGYGEYLGMLKSWRIPFAEIHPMTWKKEYSLVGIPAKEAKDRSISVAKSIFPLVTDRLARKKDHGRAEALLIAEYARRKNM